MPFALWNNQEVGLFLAQEKSLIFFPANEAAKAFSKNKPFLSFLKEAEINNIVVHFRITKLLFFIENSNFHRLIQHFHS